MIETPFIRHYPGDPEYISTVSDTEHFERIPIEERFPCCSTFEAISTIANSHGDKIALTFLPTGSPVDVPERWTYQEFYQEIIAAANAFHELGLEYQESVVILMPNRPETLFALWGAEAAGIAAPINHFLEAKTIARIAKEADARIMVTLGPEQSGELFQKALYAKENVASIDHIITVGSSTPETKQWDTFVGRYLQCPLVFSRCFSGDETASYLHTGGTTGVPKLARRTHRSEVINICQMSSMGVLPVDYSGGRNITLGGLPFFHVSAVMASGLKCIMDGGELILAGPNGFRNKQLIKDFWRLVERYKITFFNVVPTVYSALLDEPSENFDLSSLILTATGGAPLSKSLLNDFHCKTGADIVEGYGMTECGAGVTSHAFRGVRKIGSVGMRLPYQDIRIVVLDQDGKILRDCDIDEIGIILVKGPNVIPEYKQAFANEKAWPEPGWLNTGDMGRVDADGYYWITGRSKDLIIRGGHNIDPMITEESLASHPAVINVAAVGKPDAYSGELPIAYVELTSKSTVTNEELMSYARAQCEERAAAPTEVVISEALPKTAVGKIFKPDLRKDAIARTYKESVQQAIPDIELDVTVTDDKKYGLNVTLNIKKPSIETDDILNQITSCLAELTYHWDIFYTE